MGSKQHLFKVTCSRVFTFYTDKDLTSSYGGRKMQTKVFQEKKERHADKERQSALLIEP